MRAGRGVQTTHPRHIATICRCPRGEMDAGSITGVKVWVVQF